MAEHGNAFSRAYSTLHSDLRDGRFAPGARLAAADVLARLGISATPVREALSRLAGQGLLIDRPAIGYFVPVVDPVELKDLYGLAMILAHAAMDDLDHAAIRAWAGAHHQSQHRTAGELVRTVASLSSNAALQSVATNVDDRLARLSAIDAHMFAATDREQGDLEDWLATRQRRTEKLSVSQFYRRRIKSVLDIASHAARSLGGPDNIIS
ncbi:GntR family transcriptional regulator [Blastomonas sp.]|uniref:GntR family transcriptional regulator n=1 Tax=Blastomonas sp. TaxID=1909299 RepID=UPI002629B5EB|nr:GntR family transcriptional regulator [Blastomonas sp.]MDM7955798.1 GntR family transcriptional regulator [Blastomonas sp.]